MITDPIAGNGSLHCPGIKRIAACGFAAAVALFAALSLPSRAEAATINTYTFTQDGYDVGGALLYLGGSFTGRVEANGEMHLAGLTMFQASLFFDDGSGDSFDQFGAPTFFTFYTLASGNPSGGNSALTIVASGLGASQLCTGMAATIVCGAASGAFGAYGAVSTTILPRLTLVSSVTDTAVTPIPAALPLLATALGGLGLVGWRRKRQAA